MSSGAQAARTSLHDNAIVAEMMPPTKRAKMSHKALKTTTYSDLRLSFTKTKTRNGRELDSLACSCTVNLTEDVETWLKIPFGIKPGYQDPTHPFFKGETGSGATDTWLSVTLQIDEVMKKQIQALNDKILGDSSFKASENHHAIKDDEGGRFLLNVRLQVGDKVHTPRITVINEDGSRIHIGRPD